ncbi:MAG: sulfatase-like hydrolase/transferase [Acidobacteriota bacterium]
MRRLPLLMLLLAACGRPHAEQPSPAPRPSILLVTLDTTRADAVGPEQSNAETPAYNALAGRALRFRYAYATVPQTLPSHGSMLTGLYPAGHGVHENGRYFSDRVPMLAAKLKEAGYATGAFVSAFAVARRFGLGRGFDVYDDEFGTDRAERPANETTDRAIAWLDKQTGPTFVWVHYYDPHYPYTPPAPFVGYYGEVAFMDQQLGRLAEAFERRAKGPAAIIVVADHGEGLGEHGEQQHGNLLYQSTMQVPLLVAGPGAKPGISDAAVSTRRIFHTILDWAGIDATNSLLRPAEEVVVGEAMKPFLDYGWQPQVMAVEGRLKTISAGKIEVYDVVADPKESHDLAGRADIPRTVRAALQEYPIPTGVEATAPASADTEEERRKLASLGYVASTAKPIVRKGAPRPADMAKLFPILDLAAGLFVRGEYTKSIVLFEEIVSADPTNLDAMLRLATAHSSLGHHRQTVEAYTRAQAIAPDSADVRTYLGLHYARGKDWEKAVPLLERVVADDPDRLPALEGLATVRERQGRIEEAIRLRQKVYTMRTPSAAELARLGEMAMGVGQTEAAIQAFQKAPGHDLQLGVLYLAARRFEDARSALDRVPPTHTDYPMALFKRAQVSVLLHEPDAAARIDAARKHANGVTRELIERERLFR